jgi:hypothetical protein
MWDVGCGSEGVGRGGRKKKKRFYCIAYGSGVGGVFYLLAYGLAYGKTTSHSRYRKEIKKIGIEIWDTCMMHAKE